MNCFVGIATSGRMATLRHAIDSVAGQTRRPDKVFICTPMEDEDGSEPSLITHGLQLEWVRGPRGSCSQRNVILDCLQPESGVLLIMDDDFILAPDYLERLCTLMEGMPNLAIVNGRLAADGISGPGLKADDADRYIADARSPAEHEVTVEECVSIYGCNMAINLDRVGSTRFDEELPLYGWQEDVDFSFRLSKCGTVARTNLLAGVHLGVKLGRTSGQKFGYSQLANPIYLVRKGTMSPSHAARLMFKNIAMNTMRSIKPEPYIDRRGRLQGNMRALIDLFRGQLQPGRILGL